MKIDICNDTFWLGCWTLLAVSLVSIVGIVCFYNDSKNEILANVARTAVDPVAAVCALTLTDMTDKSVCVNAMNK